jgi:hypothetical protein
MSDELGLYLPAQADGVSARQAKNVLNHLLTALDSLSVSGGSSDDWTLSELRLSSLGLATRQPPA